MADLDFLDGFDGGGDWGFTSVSEKPTQTQSKETETVVKQTAEGTAKAISSDIVKSLENPRTVRIPKTSARREYQALSTKAPGKVFVQAALDLPSRHALALSRIHLRYRRKPRT